MVVRQNVAVGAQDEAGAGCGGLGLIAPVVRGDRGADADGRVDVLGVDLGGGHLLAGVDLGDVDDAAFAAALVYDGGLRGVLIHVLVLRGEVILKSAAAEAHRAADERAAQNQCGDPCAGVALLRGLRLQGRLRVVLAFAGHIAFIMLHVVHVFIFKTIIHRECLRSLGFF